MWVVRRGCGRRPELCGYQVYVVSLLVQSHSARSGLSWHVIYHGEFRGRILVDHGKNAFAAGGESQPGSRIKGVRIYAITYGSSSYNLAGVGIDYRHHLVVAAGKQAAVLAVDGQTTGLFTGGQRPACFHLQFVGIDGIDLALVFDIHKDFAFAVARGKFRFSFELDCAQHGATGSVDGSGIVAPAVERKNTFAGGIVKNGVRVFSRLDLADRLQGCEVKNCDRALAAVADETASQLGGQRDAVHARCVGNIADGLAGIGVDDHDVSGARDVKPPRRAVEN